MKLFIKKSGFEPFPQKYKRKYFFFRSGFKNLLALLLFFQKLKVEIPGYGGGVFHCSHPLRFFPTKRPTTARVGNFFERSRLISLQFWNTITTSHYLGSYDHSFQENLTSEITFFKDTELSDKKKKTFFSSIMRNLKKILKNNSTKVVQRLF